MARTFEHGPAIRKRIWLRMALAGPTGSGKSMSAQQLSLGFSLIDPGPVWLINTEGPNGLLYAPKPGMKATPPTTFNFEHLPFDPPHRTPDYLAAVRYAVENGARHVIIDGGHFEHESYLAYHEAEVTRLVGRNDTYERRKQMAMTGWIKPSAERHAALLAMRLIPANIIWCFQGKEKIHMKKKGDMDEGDKMVEMGWSPIAGAEVVAELPIRFLLPPGCDGVPNLRPELPGERLFNRVPIELRQPGFLIPGQPIDVELGKRLQAWAMEGNSSASPGTDRAAILAEIKALLKTSFPGKGKAIFLETLGVQFEKESSLPPDRLLAGLEALKARALAQTPAQVPLVDSGAPGAPNPATPDDTRSVASTIREAATAAGLPDEALLRICKGDPEEVPDSPDILDEILYKIQNWSTNKETMQ